MAPNSHTLETDESRHESDSDDTPTELTPRSTNSSSVDAGSTSGHKTHRPTASTGTSTSTITTIQQTQHPARIGDVNPASVGPGYVSRALALSRTPTLDTLQDDSESDMDSDGLGTTTSSLSSYAGSAAVGMDGSSSSYGSGASGSGHGGRSRRRGHGGHGRDRDGRSRMDPVEYVTERLATALDPALLDRVVVVQAQTSGTLNAKTLEIVELRERAGARMDELKVAFAQGLKTARQVARDLEWAHKHTK